MKYFKLTYTYEQNGNSITKTIYWKVSEKEWTEIGLKSNGDVIIHHFYGGKVKDVSMNAVKCQKKEYEKALEEAIKRLQNQNYNDTNFLFY